jgi:hypothetical protein
VLGYPADQLIRARLQALDLTNAKFAALVAEASDAKALYESDLAVDY